MLPILVLLAVLLGYHAPIHQEPHVILVTIDGTRWQEIYNGTDTWRYHGKHLDARELVPNLYNYFVDQGIAVGKLTPIIASGPNHISLPGYLEITRGHQSFDCQSNTCSPTIDQSVFWFFREPAVFASWSGIKKTIPTVANVYSDIGTPYRLDNDTEIQTIYYLDNYNPDFLWVGLGDTDEFAHRNDYGRYIDSLKNADAFIGFLVKRYPEATIIVTADHGRNADFRDHGADKASERVWLMMRGHDVPNKGFTSAAPLTLSNIMPTITDIEFGTHSNDSILSKLR